MRQHGVCVPDSRMVESAEAAEEVVLSDACGGPSADVVVKAQVLAGGRGLGHFTSGLKGGVHLVMEPARAKELAGAMLGETLVTKQTGPEGKPVEKVLIAERVYMRREMYFSILLDRASGGVCMVGSPAGGTSIEDVAEETPELIFKLPVKITDGVDRAGLELLAGNMGFTGATAESAVTVMEQLYDMFIKTDATLVEVNPLAELPDGRVMVCDAKLNFDDNAEFRQKELHAFRDRSQEDVREVEAAEYDLNYIGLDGSIGCLVNGAGLAMATMDMISLHGGSPANFLDVGGGATEKQVAKAFDILGNDDQVKSILVNIFGGIMRCDVIAAGIIAAAKSTGLKKPIVCRLQGTNVDEAKDLIAASGFRMIMADDLDLAASRAVKIAGIVEQAESADLDVSFELPL
eukprot:PLAT14664.1.p1 GENE.PLAT14664.1~~PLAT14664.1.p1  ORF type:complete len:460 (+),score=237.77 PLAT14664.1:167-1381(+)